MRTLAILAVMVLASPLVLATEASDPPGDETLSLWIGPFPVQDTRGGCSAPAADILGARASVLGDDLVISIEHASADPRLHCGGAPIGEPGKRAHRAWLFGASETFLAAQTSGDPRCVEMWLTSEGGAHDVCGSFEQRGAVTEWRIAARGTLDSGNVYDLTGETFDIDALSSLWHFEDALSFSASDSAGP